MIIAVDCPAASGKGTLAKRLATHFGLPYLDTGLLYRAIGHMMAERGFDLDNAELAATFAEHLDVKDLDHPALRTRQAGERASRVAVHGAVRTALLQFQRNFAAQSGGAVLDGRDIGTVVAPKADIKIFVTANVSERAKRRFHELVNKGELNNPQDDVLAIEADLRERDARDASRLNAPLKAAADAFMLDTSALNADMAFNAALSFIVDQMK